MKKVIPIVLASFLLSISVTAWAAVSDNEKLEKGAQAIEKTASTPNGETAVVERIEKQFNVTDSQISALRSQKLGYGEISIVFALAEKSGKTTDEIMKLRQGPPVMGWGEIAKKLDLKLGPVISSVEKTERGAHEAMTTKEERHETMQSGEGMGKQEHMGGSEHGMGGGGHR